MSSPPLVSVVMAVYNTERYLAPAVESILAQTFADFELIIINDGSTDRSLRILKKYAKLDPRIHLISRENRGIPQTRNELLANAQGVLIAPMDSDDISPPDRLENQINFLRQHPTVTCVGGAYDWIDEAARVLRHVQEPTSNPEIQQFLLAGRICICSGAAMMRRNAVIQVGGYDESLPQAEDLDLLLKLAEIGELANLSVTTLQYRQHHQSISGRRQMEQQALKKIVCERACQRREIQVEFTETKPWRPVDNLSLHQLMITYGWHFFMAGKRYPAIVYGIKAIQAFPVKIEGWKLLACALIKPLPRSNSL